MALSIYDIWAEVSEPLKKYIIKRVPNQTDADDILQEVLMKIYQSISDLKDENKLHPWIYTISRHAITDYYRRRDKPIEIIELPEDLGEELEKDKNSNLEIAACLKVMIESLPEKYKQAIVLTEFENLPQKELSERMGLSISGAKSRVQRARGKLKEMLLGCCHLEFDRMGNVIDYRHKSRNCRYC